LKLRPEQLASSLSSGLQPIYILSSDETLLLSEAADEIRAAARAAGFEERDVYSVERNFDWHQLLHAGNSMSLFASAKIIELRLSSKPSDQGKKALLTYAENPPQDTLLLITLPKLDQGTQKTKWFSTLESKGAHLPLWPIDGNQLPRWIKQRFKQNQLIADDEASRLLAEQVEGNLLAAAQEITKLAAIAGDNKITAELIRASVSDNSRFNIYQTLDSALNGNHRQVVKRLANMKEEGAEPIMLVSAIARELRQLLRMNEKLTAGQSMAAIFQSFRVWKNRQPVVQAALNRLSGPQILRSLLRARQIDQRIKGMVRGEAWDGIESLLLSIAGKSIPG